MEEKLNKLNRLMSECDEAIQTSNQKEIKALIEKIETKADNDCSHDELCYFFYSLANLHAELFRLLEEDVSDWRNNNYPENLVKEIDYLRQAEALIPYTTQGAYNEIKTNLRNALAHQRRNIEVLEYWQCNFSVEGDAPFVSIFSKSNELRWISFWLNDPSYRELYQVEAYFLLKELQNNISNTTHERIINSIKNDKEIVSFLEFGDKNFKKLFGWQKKYKPPSYKKDEKQYRKWCLINNLFANPINDITQEWIAGHDILQFPNHVFLEEEFTGTSYFSASFSAIKREYCFARFMMFEGIHKMHPDYENEQLYLTDTLDSVNYNGYVEKTKTAFRICFSVFDSIAFLMKAYFIPTSEASVSFSSKWIKDNFQDTQGNHFIDALYWLSCDLTDNDKLTSEPSKWKAPIPSLANIRKTRNTIEHNWLKITEFEIGAFDNDSDFSYSISLEVLQNQTLLLLKLARSAMLYLCMAVSFEEKRRQADHDYQKINLKMQALLIEDGWFKE